MFTRVNFLLGFGLLVLIAFYFAFRYLVIAPVSAYAPDWAKPVAGIAVLLSVGLTVQILAMAISALAGVASFERGPAPLAVASQAAMVFGHGMLAYASVVWLEDDIPPAPAGLLLLAALYAIGVALGLVEWRARRTPAA